MLTPEKEEQYAELAKLFGFVLAQYRLYSETHPAAQLAVRNFYDKLETVLQSEGHLTFGPVEGQLVINELPLDKKKTGVADLLKECDRFQIESLIFNRGAAEEEIITFFKMLATLPRILQEKGGFNKVFEEANLQHVRLGTARYQKVKEEEEVVSKDEIGAGEKAQEALLPEQARKIEKMEDLIQHCLGGAREKVDFNDEWLAYEVEKKPEIVARQMVEQAKSLKALRRIVEEIARFLQERLAVPYIQEGKDFSQPVSRLAKEFKKVLESPEAPVDFRGSIGELVGVLEQCADAIKLELIITTFQQSERDLKTLERLVGKFLRSKEVRERLRAPLREKLAALGVSEREMDLAFGAVEEKRASKRSRRADLSPEEIEELRHLRDHFQEELERRVREETVILEQEKRRVLNEKERADAIIRSIGEGLVVVDNEGKVQFMNPAAERLLGLGAGGARGVPISELLKNEHAMALAKGPLRNDPDGAAKEIELKSLNEETQRILQASTAVIENQDGKTVGMVSVLSDITKQKQLDEAKSKFVSHVSHELQTPLISIQESLAILLSQEPGQITPGQEKFLSVAQRSIGRLSRLVSDLLDVAKLEAGKIVLSPMGFELREMVRHAVETVRSWAESRGITIEEKYPQKAVDMVADPDRLTQVVTNLVGNAIKFTPEGGKISVEITPESMGSDLSQAPSVAVSVQDTGIGIAKQDQQRIFEKFEHVSLASPQGISSTGLGLTIAREIVELHGGRIWVDSNGGEGSRFTFVIPQRLPSASSDGDQPGN